VNVVGHWCGMFVRGVYQPDNHVPNQNLLIIHRRGSAHDTTLTQKILLNGRLWTSGYWPSSVVIKRCEGPPDGINHPYLTAYLAIDLRFSPQTLAAERMQPPVLFASANRPRSPIDRLSIPIDKC